MSKYKVIKEEDLVVKFRPRSKYTDLYVLTDNLKIGEIILLTPEDKLEADRIRASLVSRYGNKVFSVLSVNKDPLQYVIKQNRIVK
jgi:hypothetical protein